MNVFLEYLMDIYPNSTIYCTHDLLGGRSEQPNGYVPDDCDGSKVYVIGHFHDTNNPPKILIRKETPVRQE